MKQLVNLLSAILVIAFLAACSGNSQKSNNKESVISQMKREQVKQEVEEFVYPMPTAFEVTNMLNRIGASYIFSLSNAAENAEKYFTEKSKALNLGVYSADLAYSSTYNQKQIAMDYMDASNKLIEELGFTDAIDKEIVDKVEASEDDKEELIDLISSTFYNTYKYLNKHNRGGVSILVLSGSYVEGLYIATHISEETYNNVEMVKIIMDQKEPLAKLMELIKEYNEDQSVSEIEEALLGLNNIYAGLDGTSISKEQMDSIKLKVAEIRSGIIE